ncbi:MAG TPA: DUF5666 domain-containing protein [Patescibacteria group bacterium]|nr:DUF5666 domain-containing protein [Patescibacteria group bacterium]
MKKFNNFKSIKKILITVICLAILLLTTNTQSFAVTPTPSQNPSPTIKPTDQNLLNQINQIREKVVSETAKLKLVEKRGIVGTITDVSSTQITLNDVQNNIRIVDVDEITKFSSPNNASMGISDLNKGTLVSVLGLYNKDTQHLLARFIDVITTPTYLTGVVSSIDRANGQFYILKEDQKQTLIDVETITKSYTFTKVDDLTKSGFSKLAVGDRVFIMGYPDKNTPSMIVANRIIDFPEVAADPAINVAVSPTAQPTNATTTTPTVGAK